jgi:beta-lactamase class D OXA-29
MRTWKTLITTTVIAFHTYLFSEERNFLLYDLNTTEWLQEVGPNCDERISCCSTFKIPLSLIGFDSGILQDEFSPEWPHPNPKDYDAFWLPIWEQPHTPALWMRNSCVWFSQGLTTKLGMDRFQQYIDLFDYGNKDLSGDPAKKDGLTHAWLMSSLKISPREQIFFLAKLVQEKLPISAHSILMTKRILFLEELNGWKLFGKTGSGQRLNPDGTINEDLQSGWFVGWLEKDDRTVIFTFNLRDDEKVDGFAGRRAKEKAKELLLQFIR